MKQTGLESRAAAFIKEHDLLQTGGKVLAGVSGGADSTCLLLLLNDLVRARGGEVFAVHVNHCIRGDDADADEAFVRELCESLDIPLVVRRADVPALAASSGQSLEEAGRNARLQAFAETAADLGCSAVAAAHHRDDAAETLLMNIMRGCGPEGLKGLQPARPLNGGIVLIRPLLDVSASEIREWLLARGQTWREDLTNQDREMTRNRVRLEALPLLEDIRPGSVRNMLRMSSLAGDTYAFVEREARKVFEEASGRGADGAESATAVDSAGSSTAAVPAAEGSERALDINVLRSCDPALLPFVLRMAMTEVRGDVKDITEKHLAAAAALAARAGDGRADLPGLVVRRSGQRLIFSLPDSTLQGPFRRPLMRVELTVLEPGPGGRYPEKRYTKWFDYDKIKSPVAIRYRQPGDYITLPGGRRKLLRRWFIDEKVPQADRDSCTVLAEGSHVLWIVGGRISDHYKTGADTVRVLQAEAFPS